MDYKLSKVAYLVAFIWVCSFQLVTAQTKTDRQQADSFNTILFRVTSSETDNVSYLFGTHHAFGKSFFDSLSNANRALESCDLLIKENLNIPGAMAEDIINQRTSTTKWSNYLNKEDLTFVTNLFATSPTDFNKMSPTEMYVFLNRYFKQQICLNRGVNDTFFSLDDYIGSLSSGLEMKQFGLETTREQIDLINEDVEGMPKKKHKRRLSAIISNIRSSGTKDCEETDWYLSMEMDYQLNKPCTNSLLLTNRNNKWMANIEEKLKSTNCFIAVGLSHLMYQCGLINQLRTLGYTVTPIVLK